MPIPESVINETRNMARRLKDGVKEREATIRDNRTRLSAIESEQETARGELLRLAEFLDSNDDSVGDWYGELGIERPVKG